jgi:hypothetical protein
LNSIWPRGIRVKATDRERAEQEESFALLPLSRDQPSNEGSRLQGIDYWDWISGEIPREGDKMKFGYVHDSTVALQCQEIDG